MIIFSSFYCQGGGLHIDRTGAFVEPSPGKNNSRSPNCDVLEDYDFRVRRPAIRLLTYLLVNKPRSMQELVLASHMGVSRYELHKAN